MTDLIKTLQSRLSRSNVKLTLKELRQELEGIELTEDSFDSVYDSLVEKLKKPNLVVSDSSNLVKTENTGVIQALTDEQKIVLTEITFSQHGFTLSKEQITGIVSRVDDSINEATDYMEAITQYVKAYVAHRKDNLAKVFDSNVEAIKQILNASDQDLHEVFQNGEAKYLKIIEECKKSVPDFKSPYSDSLESIREMLSIT